MGDVEPAGSSALDSLFGELRHRRRRAVLSFFAESDVETARLDALVEYLGSRTGGAPDPERVALELHHVDLPALADAGFVAYDAAAHTVRRRGDLRLAGRSDLLAELGVRPSC